MSIRRAHVRFAGRVWNTCQEIAGSSTEELLRSTLPWAEAILSSPDFGVYGLSEAREGNREGAGAEARRSSAGTSRFIKRLLAWAPATKQR